MPAAACTARRTNGQPCHAPAIRGGRVCRVHGGSAPAVRAKAEARLEEARIRATVERLGVPIDADPTETLLGLIREAAGNVEFYRQLVTDLQPGDGGLYGRLYHQTGEPTGEARPHVLVRMYDQERDRLTQLVATALKLGLDERRVRIAEADASRVLAVIVTAISDTGLTPAQGEELRRAIAARLRVS